MICNTGLSVKASLEATENSQAHLWILIYFPSSTEDNSDKEDWCSDRGIEGVHRAADEAIKDRHRISAGMSHGATYLCA